MEPFAPNLFVPPEGTVGLKPLQSVCRLASEV